VGAADEHWIGLLRAINLAGRNRVPMAGLRALLESAGCTDVRTYVASGNVLFTRRAERSALAAELEAAIEAELGVRTPVVLRTVDELRAVHAAHPFGSDTSRTYVTFLAAEPDAAGVRVLEALDVAPEQVAVVGSDVFLRYPEGLGRARLTSALVERHLGVAGTNRNWRTVTKLVELAG
jgi:uncharacterized protein (DUF1697 family)